MTKKTSGTEDITPWELTGLPAAPDGANPAATDLQKIIRKNYREPIAEDDPIRAEIDGRSHRVCDIGNRGLSLIVPSLDTFQTGTPHRITIQIGDDTITCRGKVTHISPSETSGECHCGIEFLDLSKKDEHTLQHFLAAHHARLFAETNRSADLGRD